jgi:uroporphyrinogen-III synthase
MVVIRKIIWAHSQGPKSQENIVLQQKNVEFVTQPLFAVHREFVTLPHMHADTNGVLITSGHAVPVLQAATPCRNMPVWCVGPATADLAREAGFTEAIDCAALTGLDGAAAMTTLLEQRHGYAARRSWFYLHGDVVRVNLADVCKPLGIPCRSLLAYRMEPVQPWPDEKLRDRWMDMDAVAVFSVRAATYLLDSVRQAPLPVGHMVAGALSPAVASALHEGGFAEICVPAEASAQALLSQLMQCKT